MPLSKISADFPTKVLFKQLGSILYFSENFAFLVDEFLDLKPPGGRVLPIMTSMWGLRLKSTAFLGFKVTISSKFLFSYLILYLAQ